MKSGGSDGPRAGYHHGDLRHRLIEVGERLLEEGGVEAFTLRECARRAGVSPSAPSHHFGNVTGLLTAIAAAGFDGLGEAQESALAGSGEEPGARLRAIGMAYIRHAIAHPARFRVMFGRVPIDKGDPALVAAGSRALGILAREIRAIRGVADDPAGGPDFEAGVAFAWSAVHGFAQLLIDGRLYAVNPALDGEALLERVAPRFLELVSSAFDSRAPQRSRSTGAS